MVLTLLIRGSSGMGHMYLGEERLPSQTHLRLFPNVFLPGEERNTKLLTLTGPVFSHLKIFLARTARVVLPYVFGKCLCSG